MLHLSVTIPVCNLDYRKSSWATNILCRKQICWQRKLLCPKMFI